MELTVGQITRSSAYKKLSAEDNIAKALARLQSSHDAVFVFRKKQFLGVINLYYSFLRQKPNLNERSERAIYHPPQLKPDMPISMAAHLMAESRLYWLPVIDGNRFQGAVTARDILRQSIKSPKMKKPLAEAVPLRLPIFVKSSTTVAQARQLMLKNRVSRLVVVDNHRPKGVFSSYDLRKAIRQIQINNSSDKSARNTPIEQQKISRFFHHGLLSIPNSLSVSQALHKLLAAPAGSLAVLSPSNQILGLVSYRDFLKYLSRQQTKLPWRFSFRLVLPREEKLQIKDYVQHLLRRQQIFRKKISQVNLIFSQQNHRSGTAVYKITAQIWDKNHRGFTIVNKGRYLRTTLQKFTHQLKRRLSR